MLPAVHLEPAENGDLTARLPKSNCEFVVRRGGAGGEIDYVSFDIASPLSAMSAVMSSTISTVTYIVISGLSSDFAPISGDVNNNDNVFKQKSVHTIELNGKKYH